MTKKIVRRLLVAVLVVSTSVAYAQQAGKIYRIGYLATNFKGEPVHEAFRQGLRDFGYTEGKDIVIEWRYAEDRVDRFPELAADLVRLKVDVIVAPSASSTLAAKKLTQTIPIVTQGATPVELGLVASLARPGANITGVTDLQLDLAGKRLEFLKEILPKLTRVAVLRPAAGLNSSVIFREMEAPERALGLQLQSVEVQRPDLDLENAFEAAKKGRAGAVLVIGAPLFNRYHKHIADLALKHRLPSSYRWSEYPKVGGLMSYGVDRIELYRRQIASYVDKILKGAKPADLPVEQPTKFEFVINLKTAKALDLTIPPQVLMEADKVIK